MNKKQEESKLAVQELRAFTDAFSRLKIYWDDNQEACNYTFGQDYPFGVFTIDDMYVEVYDWLEGADTKSLEFSSLTIIEEELSLLNLKTGLVFEVNTSKRDLAPSVYCEKYDLTVFFPNSTIHDEGLELYNNYSITETDQEYTSVNEVIIAINRITEHLNRDVYLYRKDDPFLCVLITKSSNVGFYRDKENKVIYDVELGVGVAETLAEAVKQSVLLYPMLNINIRLR